jgi:hypothetical protein
MSRAYDRRQAFSLQLGLKSTLYVFYCILIS